MSRPLQKGMLIAAAVLLPLSIVFLYVLAPAVGLLPGLAVLVRPAVHDPWRIRRRGWMWLVAPLAAGFFVGIVAPAKDAASMAFVWMMLWCLFAAEASLVLRAFDRTERAGRLLGVAAAGLILGGAAGLAVSI